MSLDWGYTEDGQGSVGPEAGIDETVESQVQPAEASARPAATSDTPATTASTTDEGPTEPQWAYSRWAR